MNNNFLPYQLKKNAEQNSTLAASLAQIMQYKLKSVYGIKADGTDETTKLQNALNAETDIWIFGTIGISSSLQWNGTCNIHGSGTIKALSDMTNLIQTDNSQVMRGGTIEGVTLDCNSHASVGIYLVGKGAKVHCTVQNFKTYGIQLGYYNNPTMYKAWETDISGCRITGLTNPTDGNGKGTIAFSFYPLNGIYISTGSTDNEIYQNIVVNTKNEQIVDNAGACNIHDNHVYNYPTQYTDSTYLLPNYCYGVYGANGTFENNYADSPLLAGFYIKSYDCKVCNNRVMFALSAFGGTETGILLDSAKTGLIIENNMVTRNSSINNNLVPYDISVVSSGNIHTTSRINHNNGDVVNKFDSKNKRIRISVAASTTSFKISTAIPLSDVNYSISVMPEWDYGYIYPTSKGTQDIWFSVTKAPTASSYITMSIDYFG